MSQFAISNETVFPTFNDVALVAGEGKRWAEPQVASWVRAFTGSVDFVSSGFVIPANSGTLNITLPLGLAYLQGYRVNVPTATVITAAPSTTTYVFLRLLRDINGFVTSAVFETQLTTTPPADSMLICSLIAGVGSITNTSDAAQRSTTDLTLNEALIFVGL